MNKNPHGDGDLQVLSNLVLLSLMTSINQDQQSSESSKVRSQEDLLINFKSKYK
jgi:hypothetical protein